MLHVLKPGGVCIVLAKQAATAGPPEGKDAVSYPESVRQLFFSVGFCDITEVDTSHLRDPNKSSGHGTLFGRTLDMLRIMSVLQLAEPSSISSIFNLRPVLSVDI